MFWMRRYYTRVSASMRTGLGRGSREFGGYRATSTRRPDALEHQRHILRSSCSRICGWRACGGFWRQSQKTQVGWL